MEELREAQDCTSGIPSKHRKLDARCHAARSCWVRAQERHLTHTTQSRTNTAMMARAMG